MKEKAAAVLSQYTFAMLRSSMYKATAAKQQQSSVLVAISSSGVAFDKRLWEKILHNNWHNSRLLPGVFHL